jgi:hypothetical protein
LGIEDRDSDFYNVTVNLVVRRMPQYEADLKMKQEQGQGQGQKQQEASLIQMQEKDDDPLKT